MSGDLRALGFCICLNFEMPSWTDVALKAICGWLDGIGYLCAGYAKSTQSCEMSRIWRINPCKKLEGWGKKSGLTQIFAKSSIVLGKFELLN